MSLASKRNFPFGETRKQGNPPKKVKSDMFNKTASKSRNATGGNYQTTSVKTVHQNVGENKEHMPLAEKMRPTDLLTYVGQTHLIGPNTVLRNLLEKGQIPSIIFWGPPGCGKTSLAIIITQISKQIYGDKARIVKLSATSSGIADIKDVVKRARNESKMSSHTIILMDEIHCFNKLRQDVFLPHIEAGTFTLIGTTTENPSYSLNSALLSRCRVLTLNKITTADMINILHKAIYCMEGEIQNLEKTAINSTFVPKFTIEQDTVQWLADVCDGDARVALNSLELAYRTKVSDGTTRANKNLPIITFNDIKQSLKQSHILSTKDTNESHNLYSALCKSIRGGDANAALYWLARIMAAKEDPVNIARRLVRIASEDIGLADTAALSTAVHTMHGCQMIGMPECDVLLGQCAVYLAKAPKSRLIYDALNAAKELISNHKGPQPSVPLHIRCRSGQAKLQASLGATQSNLLREEEASRSYLPHIFEHVNFFHGFS